MPKKSKPKPKVEMVEVPKEILTDLLNAAEDGIARCTECGYTLSEKRYERAVQIGKAALRKEPRK